MNRRTALTTLAAGTVGAILVPTHLVSEAPLVGYFDLKDFKWDEVGAFNSDGKMMHGIRRQGEMVFTMNFNGTFSV